MSKNYPAQVNHAEKYEIIACFWCGQEKLDENGKHKLKQCSKCKLAAYCNLDCQTKDWKEHKAKCKALTGQYLTLVTAGENDSRGIFQPYSPIGGELDAWVKCHGSSLVPLGYYTMGCPIPSQYNALPPAERKVIIINVQRDPKALLPSRKFRIVDHFAEREVLAQRIYTTAAFIKNRARLHKLNPNRSSGSIDLSFIYQVATGKDEMTYLESSTSWAGCNAMRKGLRPSDPPDWMPSVIKAQIHGEPTPPDPPEEPELPEDERLPSGFQHIKGLKRKGDIMYGGGLQPQNIQVTKAPDSLGGGSVTTFTIDSSALSKDK